MIKRGSGSVSQVTRNPEKLPKILMNKLANDQAIKLDPDKYLYVRNRAISGEETWGPNQNWDAFPANELRAGVNTFINRPVSIDHNPGLCIGKVVDTAFLDLAIARKVEGKTASEVKLTSFNGYASLQPGDQVVGNWIENAWAIEKEALDGLYPHAVEAILDGAITDTSMGTSIETSECTVCGNRTDDPIRFPYCEHVGMFGVNKGTEFEHPVTGILIRSAERCFGINFFEDSLIMPGDWNGIPNSQGADVSAKILQILASKTSMTEVDAKKFAEHLRLIYDSLDSQHREAFIQSIGTLV